MYIEPQSDNEMCNFLWLWGGFFFFFSNTNTAVMCISAYMLKDTRSVLAYAFT